MCRIENIKEIFHPWPFLAIVFHHQRQGQNHTALQTASRREHLQTELVNAEQKVDRAKLFPALPHKIQHHTQSHEGKSVFVDCQIREKCRTDISVQIAEEGKEGREQVIEKLDREDRKYHLGPFSCVLLKHFNGAD